MTANRLFQTTYDWADANAAFILLAATALPLLGAAAAQIAKGGKTDADGRLIASIVVGCGVIAFVLEVTILTFTRSVLGIDILDANFMLLTAPVVFIGLSLASIRWVFPLNQLASVRQTIDIALFFLACWGIFWLFGKFHWGVVFFGGLVQLGLILIIGGLLVYRLYKRATSSDTRS